MNSVDPVCLPPHAEKTREPLEQTVLTQTDPAGQFAAVGTLSPSDCYPVGPVGPYVTGGPAGPDVYITDPNSWTHMIRMPPDPVGQDVAANGTPYKVVENILDGRPMEGVMWPELLEYSLRFLDAALDGGLVERISEWELLMNPAISYTLDSRPMEGTTHLERSALGVSLDSRPAVHVRSTNSVNN